jgi:hypothetical protein
MTKAQMKKLIEISLADSQELFENKQESQAYIIGYLQGTLKMINKEISKGIFFTADPPENLK